jgi:hypothetical protein
MRFEKTRIVIAFSVLAAGCGGENTDQQGSSAAPGAQRSTETAALETGANVMQDKSPVSQISMYLVGFHPAKADPALQMESHHYCDQVNEDFAQCVLYDGNTNEARLHGIEYIISEKLYNGLPADEKIYWHPHNYEILSGALRLPGLPDLAEEEALERKINSYGKTWHVWKTGVHEQSPDALPLGPAHLAWSFNADGEAHPAMITERDQRMNLNTAEARRARADLASLARPQGGVAAMATKFQKRTGAPQGVTDSGDRTVDGIPVLSVRGQ